jgi:hypothetical protein
VKKKIATGERSREPCKPLGCPPLPLAAACCRLLLLILLLLMMTTMILLEPLPLLLTATAATNHSAALQLRGLAF